MDNWLLERFCEQIKLQSKFALLAVEDMEKSLASMSTRELPIDEIIHRFWCSTQSFLGAVANISKLLWNEENEKIPNRSDELRKSLSIEHSSVLQPKRFRNIFEHFDEYLEDWFLKSKNRNSADCNIGPPDMIDGFETSDYLRNFDPITWILTYQGESYDLKPVIGAVKELHEKSLEVLKI